MKTPVSLGKIPRLWEPAPVRQLCLALGLAMLLPHVLIADPADQPDIIFILVDDLGYGDLGSYGCTDIATPNLDRMAETGIRFTEAYVTAPKCAPSRAGLMTGRYQQRFGFRHNPAFRPTAGWLGLDLDEQTMGDVMTQAGYRTGAFGKWHLGATEAFHPNSRGFYEFYGFTGGGHCFFPAEYEAKMREWAGQETVPTSELFMYATPLEINGVPLPAQDGYLTDLITRHAISFMKLFEHRPLFVFLSYNAPHVPLEAPPEYLRKYRHIKEDKRRVYAAMVDNLDWNIGRLLDALDEMGRRDNTLIVFMSDNGGNTNEGANNGPLLGKKAMMTEGGLRVPLIMNWPNGLPSGREINFPVSALDLLPTFAAAAGVRPDGKPLDGVNLLPWLRGEATGIPHERLFWENHDARAVRDGNFKLLRTGEAELWRLYDLSEDRGEKNDLAAQMPGKVKAMEELLAHWLEPMPPARWNDPQQ